MKSRLRTLMSRTPLILLVCIMLLGSVMPLAASPPAQSEADLLLIAARTDIEALANAALTARPIGWTANADTVSPSFVVDLRLDLELFVGAVYGLESRPAGWVGAVPGSSLSLAQDIRHDLELLADGALGYDVRPEGWVGANALLRCNRTTQALARWLQQTEDVFEMPVPIDGTAYCPMLSQHLLLLTGLLQNPEPLTGDIRVDLDRLASAFYDIEPYPEGWTAAKDASAVRQDLNFLRAAMSEQGRLVDDALWYNGAMIGEAWLLDRINRHDLELLADTIYGINTRPDGWTNFDALAPCDINTQLLVLTLKQDAAFVIWADATSQDYCNEVAEDAVQFAAAPPAAVATVYTVDESLLSGQYANLSPAELANLPGVTLSPNAYLDPTARLKIGVIPNDIPFTAMARSSVPDSKMMLISGDGFTVWAGWYWTTVTEEAFNTLPYAEQVELPQLLCSVAFCIDIIHNGDPMGGEINVGVGGYEGAGQVASSGSATTATAPGAPQQGLQWITNDAVFMIFRDELVGQDSVEVMMQICPTTSTCQPVTRLYEEGQLVPPVRSENGQPMWALRYEYHGTARVESASYYAEELWVPVPSQR